MKTFAYALTKSGSKPVARTVETNNCGVELEQELRNGSKALNELSPEEWAEALVSVSSEQPGAPWSVEMGRLLPQPIRVCTHQNPTLVEDDANRIKAYLAALIREARRRKTTARVLHDGEPAHNAE